MFDVVVVGGGPAGSMSAWEVAKGGASVCIFEKNREISQHKNPKFEIWNF